MSRSRKQTRRERPRTSVLVVVVIQWRTAVLASVLLVANMFVHGSFGAIAGR
ncbi:hypothetical protein [Streptomyces sp. SID13031]|uniref:hypothetical protein n=1 Tax=Streptomyces sp. SID13031 TaxID=2706046 RepID=UPI0013CB7F46|nr:hypothetical protein [Streptomyces sp. SID13031]NEA34270.1 hypothetical protein [Streptomyces sp. SID13031]